MSRKDLILRAIKRQSETVSICKQDKPMPEGGEPLKVWLAIEETRAIAKGRLLALEAVLSAMNGDDKMLRYYGDL